MLLGNQLETNEEINFYRYDIFRDKLVENEENHSASLCRERVGGLCIVCEIWVTITFFGNRSCGAIYLYLLLFSQYESHEAIGSHIYGSLFFFIGRPASK